MFKIKPVEFIRHPHLYLRTVPDKGRGVFCSVDIQTGDVLEVTPALVLREEHLTSMASNPLTDYVFSGKYLSDHICLWEKIDDRNSAACVAMGMVSFCNHMPVPNAQYVVSTELNTVIFTLSAVVDIPKDTEIGISYGANWLAARMTPKAK